MITVEKYTDSLKQQWDNFVAKAKNGHFMFIRDYMEYHKDRFTDNSLLFYHKNKLIALLPANIYKNQLISHGGLTFGGFVYSDKMKTAKMLDAFYILKKYMKENNLETFIYKACPYIYHKYPAQEDLYALFRNNAQLYRRDVSSTIDLKERLSFSQSRKGMINKAKKYNVKVSDDWKYLSDFWLILTNNLKEKYGIKPTHTVEEITYLREKFPDNIILITAIKDTEVIAGSVLYLSYPVAHVQYMGANKTGKEYGGLDIVIDYAIANYQQEYRFFDFGNSNENDGKYLNEGLIFQKEGFGGRAVVYDFYRINL